MDSIETNQFGTINMADSQKIPDSTNVLDHRMIDGHWQYSQNLLSILGVNDQKLQNFNTNLGTNYSQDVLVTIFALAYIQANPNKFGGEISIMVSKSKRWLKTNIKADSMDLVNILISDALTNL